MATLAPSEISTSVPACPRCGEASQHELDAVDRNRSESDERFEYRRCLHCGVIFLLNVPPDLESHYPSDYHESLTREGLETAATRERGRVELVSAHVTGGQLVEIGPSRGAFAAAARSAGFDVVALEMDASCCRHLEAVVGVRAIQTSSPEEVLPRLAGSRAVVMWHVIEHLRRPWALLGAVVQNLEPGGLLALATPNPDSFQRKVLRSRWVHLDAPRHLTLIPLASLVEELEPLGLELLTATTDDSVGRELNQLGWERSVLRPPALRADPRFAHTVGRGLAAAMSRVERRELRGAAYTAVFRKTTGVRAVPVG